MPARQSLPRTLSTCTSPTAEEWIKAVRADDLSSLHAFVNGLEHDLVAFTAGLTLL